MIEVPKSARPVVPDACAVDSLYTLFVRTALIHVLTAAAGTARDSFAVIPGSRLVREPDAGSATTVLAGVAVPALFRANIVWITSVHVYRQIVDWIEKGVIAPVGITFNRLSAASCASH